MVRKRADDEDHHARVKNEARQRVRSEQLAFLVSQPLRVDDVQDHRREDQEHAEDDRDNEDRVDRSDARKRNLRGPWSQPQCRCHILKSEA